MAENIVKSVIFLHNQVQIDLVFCMSWKNTQDRILISNPRIVSTYFLLMPIKGRVIVKTEKSNGYIEKGQFLF